MIIFKISRQTSKFHEVRQKVSGGSGANAENMCNVLKTFRQSGEIAKLHYSTHLIWYMFRSRLQLISSLQKYQKFLPHIINENRNSRSLPLNIFVNLV